MDSDADNYCSASEISRDIIDLEVAPVDMGIPVLWHPVALYYQISQQYFGTESLLSSATQCSSPGISQLHIIKYHPGIDRFLWHFIEVSTGRFQCHYTCICLTIITFKNN